MLYVIVLTHSGVVFMIYVNDLICTKALMVSAIDLMCVTFYGVSYICNVLCYGYKM